MMPNGVSAFLFILIWIHMVVEGKAGSLHEPDPTAGVLSRHNYGVTFNRLDTTMITAHSHEILTFSITVNGISQRIQWENATTQHTPATCVGLSQCMQAEVSKIDVLAMEILIKTQEDMRTIDHMMKSKKNRNKRGETSAPLQVIGDLLGMTTGVATRPDVNMIKSNFQKMTDYVTQTDHRTINSGRAFINMLEIQEQTLQLVMDQIDVSSSIFGNITSNMILFQSHVDSALVTLESFQNNITKLQMVWHNKNTNLMQLRLYADKIAALQHAISALNAGTIPKLLVDELWLNQALQNLQTRLTQQDKSKYIIVLPLSHYYKYSHVAHGMYGEVIHITMAIPVAENRYPYTLYRIQTQPVPIHPTQNQHTGFTMINQLTKYIATTKGQSKERVVQFEEQDMATCRMTDILECELPLTELDINNPTCEMALFMDFPDAIQILCNFDITFSKSIPHRVTPISQSSYIVATNAKEGTLVCTAVSGVAQITTPAYSVISIPCGCRLTVTNISLINANHSCSGLHLKENVISHTFNIPFLKAMGNKFEGLLGSTLSIKPLVLHYIQIKKLLQRQKWGVSLLANKTMDLRQAAKHMQHSSQSILPHFHTLYSYVGDYLDQTWLVITTNIIIIVLVFLTVHNSIRLCRLALIVSGFTRSRAADMDKIKDKYRDLLDSLHNVQDKAQDLTTNATITEDTAQQTGTTWDTGFAATVSPLVLLALIGIAIYLCIKCCRCMRKRVCGCIPTKGQHPMLVIKLFHTWRVVTCPIMTLPYEANMLRHSIAPRLTSIRTDCCGCKLHMDFETPLNLMIGGVEMPVEMPTMVSVPLLDRWMVKCAFAASHKPPTSLSIVTPGESFQLAYPTVGEMNHLVRREDRTSEWQLLQMEDV